MTSNSDCESRVSERPFSIDAETGLRYSPLAGVVSRVVGLPRTERALFSLVSRIEGGEYYSFTLRRLLLERYGVFVGAYSYGQWAKPAAMPSGTVIGRYVSMARNVTIFTANHPYDRLSTAPYFFNASLGFLKQNTVSLSACRIGHDAWIGHSAILTPGCSKIGIGAVVGAGAVVTKNVPDFAIVAGNPAKLLKYRFDEPTRNRILESRWWERTLDNLLPYLRELTIPLSEVPCNHPLLLRADSSVDLHL